MAAMDSAVRRAHASLGGKAAARLHPLSSKRARAMGRKGGRPANVRSLSEAWNAGSPGFRSETRRIFAEFGASLPSELSGGRRAAK